MLSTIQGFIPTIHDYNGLLAQSFLFIASMFLLFAVFIRIIRINKNFYIPVLVLVVSFIPSLFVIKDFYGDISNNPDFVVAIAESLFWSIYFLWFLVVYELIRLYINKKKEK